MSQEMNEEGMVPAENEDFNLDYTGSEEELENPQDVREEVVEPTSEAQPEEQPEEVQPEEQPLSEVESLQKQLNEALGIISQYEQQRLLAPQSKPAQPQDQPQDKPAPSLQTTQPGQVAKLDFLQGVEDHVDVLQDRDKFNNLLCQVATVAYNAAVQSAQEQVMLKIPSIVQSAAQQQTSLAETTREFYANNADLVPFKQAVSMAAMQLYNENPKLALPELLAGAAQRTREILRLTKPQTKARRPAQPAGGSIRSAGGNRGQAGQPQMSEQERQIADLLTF